MGVFDPEGPGVQKNEGAAKKDQQPQKPSTGEGPQGLYMQYDNEMGAMMLDLPPRFSKYKADLEEDLMDEFYGAPAGGKESHQAINEWIGDWIRKKEAEDPNLVQPDYND